MREVITSSGIITTVVGTGTAGYSDDGGPATQAQLNTPNGLALDSAGGLFIADDGNNVIREVAAGTGTITTVAGTGAAGYSGDDGAATAAMLNGPANLAVDSAGNLFIADDNNNRLREVTANNGHIATVAGTGWCCYSGDGGPAAQAALNQPNHIALDGAGNLFIADDYNHRIREVVAATGIITTVAGTGIAGFSGDGGPATQAQLWNPDAVAVDDQDNLYIADTVNNAIRKVIARTGVITTVAGLGTQTQGYGGDGGPATQAQLSQPNGLTVDRAGDIFIADTFNNRIREVNARTGVITTVVGGGSGCAQQIDKFGDGCPATEATLNDPWNVTLDSAGNLFIADDGDLAIREVLAGSGIIITVAGEAAGTGCNSTSDCGDGGPATQAYLYSPVGVAVDAADDIFIANYYNKKVREVIASTGIITTVASNGSPGCDRPMDAGVFGSTGPCFGGDSTRCKVR